MPDVNAQFNVAAPGSLAVRVATWQRRRMFARFLAAFEIAPAASILDVGVTSDRSYESSNYLEAWYAHPDRIVAAGIDDVGFLEADFPGVRVVRADGRHLPFADGVFDYVHSSAVLEHVGSRAAQAAFVAELARVARRGVFLTTPNRWFPVEFHSVLPLVHWLPAPWFRAILRRLGHDVLAEEANLNLLGARDVAALARGLTGVAAEIGHVRLLGWPSNLLLTLRRTG